MFKRTDPSKLTSWYFEIDRRLLACLFFMFFIGVLCALSAGSVAAERIGQPWFFFAKKAVPFYLLGVSVLFFASMLNKKWVWRLSVLNVAVGLPLLAMTVIMPHKIKGSARFVSLFKQNVMPSDIMKPGFIILTAWFLAKMHEQYGAQIFTNRQAWQFRWLSWWTYLVIFLPALVIVFLHPDVGTSLLYMATLGLMLLIAGLPWLILGVLGLFVGMGGFLAFMVMPHVHNRVMAFVTGDGNTYQVDKSVESIQHGGLLGRGDDSFIKQSLPDAHTDFIYATIAEDIGALMCCALLGLLLYTLKCLISDAIRARDPFVFYATGGAAALFGSQICINMMTTLRLMPPKGMTLPFISYGGSSFVAFCLLFGMILAIVREDKWK